MELDNVILYRITHVENIPHVLQYGITHKDSQNKSSTFKNIGDLSLIDNRSEKAVVVDNGNSAFDKDLSSIVLGDFIPFYFGVRMPMLYVAQHGGNFVEKPTAPDDIVYLACPLSKVISSRIDFFFTDGHAFDMLTSFYDATMVNELVSIVDWDAVRSSYWGGNENLDVKRKKQAELLVARDLPPDFITGFGCYNDLAKSRLVTFGVEESKIKVIPKAYY
ncbi:type II toxin-antitoxin system toxin DNA ADP-ribosyl transferase DarT [Geofilum rubicundum]|uniref:DarT domain-containing protein n=1 Tax=Geofilum rubicundum JCM 15548 TaxID=1236989 RepID=A0A0E9LS25_9BACT|nr:DUF4433 domain-containing protein [Geofilum rubicundum]GAO27665.1 hypothetical protein JCM15548_14506 [Geofilum rubicundum JCM 15548]